MALRASEVEKTKLSATYANGIAVAIAALGAIAPWIAALVQSAPVGTVRLTVGSAVCISISIALHLGARTLLDRLDTP